MPRRLQVQWQEDPDALRRLYQRERDGQHRTRLHALWLLCSGKTAVGVAETLGVGQRTLHNWVNWYRRGGLAELRRHRRGGARSTGRCRLTVTQQEALRDFTRSGRCFRVADAQAYLLHEFGIYYSYWGMWELLHRLRIRPKRPRSQAAKASPAAQAAWKGGADASARSPRDTPR